jgi:hypothetical protein
MKCWYSAFNAQGLRRIIVVVQLGAVKIYVAAVEGLRKKERQDETQCSPPIWGFSEFHPPLNANVLFCRFFFKNLTLCMTKLRVLMLCFSYFADNSNVTLGKAYGTNWGAIENMLRNTLGIWGIYWKLDENTMRTWWEHHENLMGTHWEQNLAKGQRGKEKSLGIMRYILATC